MKLLSATDFFAETMGGRPNKMDMGPYEGESFLCVCGKTHTFNLGIVHVLRELPKMRLVFECPDNHVFVTCLKIKGLFRFKGFESLFGAKVEEELNGTDILKVAGLKAEEKERLQCEDGIRAKQETEYSAKAKAEAEERTRQEIKAKSSSDNDWGSRTLCGDESCIGIIDNNDRCTQCGKTLEEAREEAKAKDYYVKEEKVNFMGRLRDVMSGKIARSNSLIGNHGVRISDKVKKDSSLLGVLVDGTAYLTTDFLVEWLFGTSMDNFKYKDGTKEPNPFKEYIDRLDRKNSYEMFKLVAGYLLAGFFAKEVFRDNETGISELLIEPVQY